MTKSLILSLSIVLLLASCATGPDYHRPEVVAPGRFLRAGADLAPLPDAAEDAFWQRFDDPTLSTLVTDALGANHDLRSLWPVTMRPTRCCARAASTAIRR